MLRFSGTGSARLLIRSTMVSSMVACLLMGGECLASDTQLLRPVMPSVVFQDGNSGAALGPAGDYTNFATPTWSIAQWGIQSNLTPAWGSSSGWSIANPYARVAYYPQIGGSQNVYELAQANNNVCNHERDLFLQTGDPTFVSGTSRGMTTSAPLSQLGSIQVNVGLNLYYVSVANTCAPRGYWDYSQYVYSIILNSTSGQTLFYQINLGRSSDPGRNPNVSWCPVGYEDSNNQLFCLDDDVRNMGGTWLVPGSNVVNSFDFLPRILQVLAAGHRKVSYPSISLDQAPSHWTLANVYVGEIIQGGAVSTSRWYGLGLGTVPGGTFCNGSHTVQWSCGAGRPDGNGWVDVGSGCFHRDTGLACL